MESKSSDKRFALLIDADNVSARYIKPILNELSKYGTVTIKRIYGDWTLTLHAKWKDALLENSITPIQQFGYTQGKNATDSAMIIDAMDILYTDSVDGFCIVSSDSDFTRLASRLRESGRMVVGMGEKKTPTPFRRACDVFTTLELLVDQKRGKSGAADAAISREEIEQAVVDIITENQNNDKTTGLGEVGSRLLKRYPDFDVRSYGTNLLSKLLEEFTRVKITKSHSSVTVELAEGADKPVEKDMEKPRERSASRHSSPKNAPEPAPASADETPADAEQHGDEPQAKPAKNAEQTARKPQRRRRVRKSTQAGPSETNEPAVDESEKDSEDRDANAADVEHADPVAEPTPGVEPAAEADERQDEPRAEEPGEDAGAAQAQDEPADVAHVPAQQATENAEVAQGTASGAKPRRRPRRPRKDVATPDAPTLAPADEDAPHASSDAATEKTPAPVDQTASADAKTTRKNSRKRSKAKSSSSAKAEAAVESANSTASETPGAATPQEVIREAIIAAGDEGISLAQVGNVVRTRFKDFKVRDLGFPQMRLYIKSVEDYELIRNGKDLTVKMAR